MKRILLALALLLLATPALYAQTTAVPSLMNFQGRLAKPDGTPLPDGSHTVTFTLFTAATGGTQLWTETDTVTVHNGAFAVLLGKTTPLTDAVFAANEWLEIKVDGGAALTPRQQLVSVANAFKADTALTVPDGSITLSKLASGVLNFNNIGGTLNSSQFAAGTIPTNALAGNPFAALSGFSTGPVLLSSIGTGATPTSVAVSGTVACVTNRGSATLQVFNVSNPAAPTLASTVGLGYPPFWVTIVGHYAYVVGSLSIPQAPPNPTIIQTFMSIVDISNPAAATVTGGVGLYGIPTTSPIPTDTIAVSGNYAYITDNLFNVVFTVNVSNPASPSIAGSVGTGAGPRDIAVAGNYAYVVNTGANTLQVINVSNPASPSVAGSVATQASPNSVAVSGNYVYALANGTNTLQVFNVSNPASPTSAGSAATAGSPNRVFVSGSNAYVVNGLGNNLQVFSLSNPTSPSLTQTVATDNNPWGLAVANNLVYVTGYYDNVLQIFTLNGAMSTSLQFANGISTANIYSPTDSVYLHGYAVTDGMSVKGDLYVDSTAQNTGNTISPGLRFGANGSGEGIASDRSNHANPYGLDFYTNFSPRMSITNGGNVGVNTLTPLAGFMSLSHDNWNPDFNNGWGDFLIGDGTRGLAIGIASGGAGAGATRIWTKGGQEFISLGGATNRDVLTINGANVGIGTTGPQAKLDVNGVAQVHAINIIGGSDVAEPYAIAPAGKVRPIAGMVVAIDTARIGQMRVAGKAYDRTVSGIISGAGGVAPGITLTQKGTVADGSLPVASMGRVWCLCDADANGPIAPGDMLTTSNTAGHAMRVTNHRKADGATIGKAMSSLKHGKGLVLVLVSLK